MDCIGVWCCCIIFTMSENNPHKPTQEERQAAIKTLAEKYHITDLNKPDEMGETPLMEAASDESRLEVLQLLITAGADVNATSEEGVTAVACASEGFNPRGVELLVAAGADVNIADEDGQTPLMMAAGSDSDDIVAILLKAGADVNAEDASGATALQYAVSTDSVSCIKPLREAGGTADKELSTIRTAVLEQNAEEVKALLSSPQKPKLVEIQKAAANACESGHVEMLKLLLPHVGKGRILSFLLGVATTEGLADCVRLLLEAGADPNGMDAFGSAPRREQWFDSDPATVLPPISNAVVAGSTDCVRLLLKYGAAPDLDDDNGTTPLEWAEDMDQEECAKLIREAMER